MPTTVTYKFELDGPETASLNCGCDELHQDTDTLVNMRKRVMRRLGFSAQAANPPPGMADFIDDLIRDAQTALFLKFDEFRGERFFSWPLETGQKFYDFPANLEECAKRLDPNKLTWVGIAYDDGRWVKLINGIPPELYDHQPPEQRPYRYERRQCFELFPAPNSEPGKLVVLGHFGLLPLLVDTDRTTIDQLCVFNMAVSLGKAHYKHSDAGDYANLAFNRMGDLTAAGHGTKRYVPSDPVPPPPPEPTMKDGFIS